MGCEESLSLNGNREDEELVCVGGLSRWSSPCPAPPPCHRLVSMQGVQIDGAELGWPTMGLTMWVWLGEDSGSQHRSVPANCSGGLFPPAPHGPPRAASSCAVLCYPTGIIRNLEGESLATEHLLGSERPNPFVKGESALCYGAEPPRGGRQCFLLPLVGVRGQVGGHTSHTHVQRGTQEREIQSQVVDKPRIQRGGTISDWH